MDTYEKKYNEAMLRADEAVQKGCLDKNIFDIIFPPEESEDERIRKWILEKVQGYADSGIPCSDEIQMANKALAWLEKQKDKNCLACDQHLKGYIAGRKVKEEEKQKEQKPDVFGDILSDSIPDDWRTKLSTNDSSNATELKAENMDAIEACMLRYLQSASNRKDDDEIMGDTRKYKEELVRLIQKPAEWSDYKDKVNVPYCSSEPEWSEEDESCWNLIWDVLDGSFTASKEGYKKAADWFLKNCPKETKSLRPSWKPSEAQLNALNFAITYFMHETNYKNPTELRDLYEHLKNL